MVENNTVKDMNNLRHMLGADSRYKQKEWGFRNHFCANTSGSDFESMLRLEAQGLVIRGATSSLHDGANFYATKEGCEAIGFTKNQIEKALEP